VPLIRTIRPLAAAARVIRFGLVNRAAGVPVRGRTCVAPSLGSLRAGNRRSGYAARVRGRSFLVVAVVSINLAGPLLGAARARADSSSPLSGWYGWQLALADAAAVGLTFAPVDDDLRGATVTVGLMGLFANGAVINMTHDNAPAASRSLLRLPAFLLGRLFGFGLGELFCEEAGCKAPLLTAGSGFGLGTVVILDLFEAFEPGPWWLPPPEPPPPPPAERGSPLASPSTPTRRGLAVLAPVFPIAAGRF
jgi:hypothetical protein